MRRLRQAGMVIGALVILTVAGAAIWLHFAPPALLRVGAGYAAKIVCSNVFIAGRDPAEILAVDVQAPGHPLLRLMEVEQEERRVRASLLGIFASNEAVYRDGLGCAVAPEGTVADLDAPVSSPPREAASAWPNGEQTESQPAFTRILR